MTVINDIRKEVSAQLAPLFEEADAQGLWFRLTYQGVEFSPDELREAQKNGQYWFGAVNWRLFDPKTLIKDPAEAYRKAALHNKNIFERMYRGRE